ncbi:MAG: PmoA family protein [Armatimonadota bacterium]|nr:PmoA family protein [Armatimonadota bacterium]
MRAVILVALSTAWLLATDSLPCGASLRFSEDADFITVFDGQKPVLRYVRGEILPEGAPEKMRRSTYVHPIYSLDGVPLTDDGPKDHYHHRGLSWMWSKVTFDGVTRNLWSLVDIHQHYRSHTTSITSDGRAVLTVKNVWQEDATQREIIRETVMITVHPLETVGRFIDVQITLSAVDTPVNLKVSDTGYGGFTLRFGPRKETTILTSKGPVQKDVDRYRVAWADLSGRFRDDDVWDGIAVFENRQNPHFPTGWTLRFYGLLNPALGSTLPDGYTIEVGKPLTLRYRLLVHKNKVDDVTLFRIFNAYNESG